MEQARPLSAISMFLRSLLPSYTSLTGCFLMSLALVSLHTLYVSISSNNYLPELFGGHVVAEHINGMFDSLETFSSSRTMNTLLQIVLWSFVGLLFFGLIELCLKSYRTWRNAKREVSFAGEGQVIPHPRLHNIVMVVAWRLFIGVVAILLVIMAQPVLRWILAMDTSLLTEIPFHVSLFRFFFAILAWALMLHCGVVLLRLYMLRPRLFGGEVY